jgi:TolA-binding protein
MCSPFSSRLFPSKKRHNLKLLLLFLSVLLVFNYTSIQAAEPASLTAEADQLLAAGDYAGALAEYQQVVTRAIEDKDYFRAKTGVGKCQAALKQTEGAKDTFRNLLYEHPDLDDDREVLNGYKALVDLTGCREAEPKDAAENLIQGIYLFSENDYPAARGKYQGFLGKYPADKNAYYVQYQVGRTFYREKDYEKAITEFRKTADEYPLSNKAGSAEWVIGYCRHYQENYGEAVIQFQKFIQDYPDHPMITDAKERLAALIHLMGMETGERSYWYQAMEVYNQLHDEQKDEKPERAAFARMQGAALTLELALRGEAGITHDDAVRKCREVKEQYPEAPAIVLATAKLMEGEVQFYQGYKEESLLAYEELFADFEGKGECGTQIAAGHVMCGITLRALDRREDALAHFEKVITDYGEIENFAGCNFVNDALVWKAFLLSTRNFPNVAEDDLYEALLISLAVIEEETDVDSTTPRAVCAQETVDRVQELAPELYFSVLGEFEGGVE